MGGTSFGMEGTAFTSAESIAQSVLARLGDNAKPPGGEHILRSLAPLPDGSLPTKLQVIQHACNNPPGAPLIRGGPDGVFKQTKPLPHGGFQITTPCGQAHIKVQPSTGSIDICGSKPSVALPYVQDWTTDSVVCSRRNKKRNAHR